MPRRTHHIDSVESRPNAFADFALVMIPAIAAPIALLLHVYAIRGVVLGRFQPGWLE